MIHGRITQGTTPDLQFSLPFSVNLIQNIRIAFSQKEKLLLIKDDYECELDKENNAVITHLTQDETFLFDENKGIIVVTLRILLKDEKVAVADEIYLAVNNITDKAVMY